MFISRQLPNEPQSLYSSRLIDAFISSRLCPARTVATTAL